ncbi:unnamed protein product [Menidia menidia]|uniref:(Atlantic silverside) hypothetical protein n=1 Tax=Menidia menidia TaxID=238744 RepID=A0A8S4B8Y3_9TELE|nr:unnamed protein product [Menidia menidia]
MCAGFVPLRGPVVSLRLVFVCLCAPEVTVRNTELRPCEEDARVCVSDPADCAPRPPPVRNKSLGVLDLSCFYQSSDASVTCSWTQELTPQAGLQASLIFTQAPTPPPPGPIRPRPTCPAHAARDCPPPPCPPRSREAVRSCSALFSPAAVLTVTARVRSYAAGGEIWSHPHPLPLYRAVRPPRPVLTVLGSSSDWLTVPDPVPAHAHRSLTHRLTGLRPRAAYRAAVACRGRGGPWSPWSAAVSGRTLDAAPPRPSELCYRLEETDSGSVLLHLSWKPEAGVLGYELLLDPGGSPRNVTGGAAVLEAGGGGLQRGRPRVQHGRIRAGGRPERPHTHTHRHLWVSSSYPAERTLRVQWAPPSPPPRPPSAMLLCSGARRGRRRPAGGPEPPPHVEPGEIYLVSVFPVQQQLCGPAQSLEASLRQGALVEPVGLKVVSVTKTTVSVMWAWQRKSGPIRRRHTFSHLTSNSEYSLLLLADNVSRSLTTVTTEFSGFCSL